MGSSLCSTSDSFNHRLLAEEQATETKRGPISFLSWSLLEWLPCSPLKLYIFLSLPEEWLPLPSTSLWTIPSRKVHNLSVIDASKDITILIRSIRTESLRIGLQALWLTGYMDQPEELLTTDLQPSGPGPRCHTEPEAAEGILPNISSMIQYKAVLFSTLLPGTLRSLWGS